MQRKNLRSNLETEWLNNIQRVPTFRTYNCLNPATQWESKLQFTIHLSNLFMNLNTLFKNNMSNLKSVFILNFIMITSLSWHSTGIQQ